MRTTVIVALVLLSSGLVPLASGFHLSVGSQDAVLVSPTEDQEDPTVSQDLYERGIAQSGCFTPHGDLADQPQEGLASAQADEFCGRLAYHAGSDAYRQISPPDQTTEAPIGGFDVIINSYVGNYGLSTCNPWCQDGGQVAYEALHDAGHTVGLTDSGSEAWAGDQGSQTYAINLQFPNALLIGSRATGTTEGNGWLFPVYDQSLVGLLTDAAGDPVDDETLETIVAQEKAAGNLPAGAVPAVCGFSPDTELSIAAPQVGFCEVLFVWAAEQENPDTSIGDGYQDPCASPAYVCGQFQPAWYGQLVCPIWLCTEHNSVGTDGGSFDSTTEYDIWHWVVAPTISDCGGLQEPGFTVDTGTDKPFLAHDLDVYEPVSASADIYSTGEVQNWADAVADAAVDQADVPALPSLPGLPGSTDAFLKEDRVEPNADGDTSQSKHVITRSLDDPCLEILEGSETDRTVDPWVEIIDSEVDRDLLVATSGLNADGYGDEDPNQDASNRPGPGTYFTNGKVGMFTDKNDDGDYDQVDSGEKFKEVTSAGAYPMIWDIWLNTDGSFDTDAGCRPGFSDLKLTEQAQAAGYGPTTGLLQVIYLAEPTVLRHSGTGQTFAFPEGDTAFVFTSQSLGELKGSDTDVQAAIQDALDQLPTTPGNVVYPGDLASVPTDFEDQCSESTGGFSNTWTFTHACDLGCTGDTVVTGYLLEVDRADGTLGGADIPPFKPQGHPDGYDFTDGQSNPQLWLDIDPLDNDPNRNTDGDSAPPTGS